MLTQTSCRNVHQSDTVRGQGVTSLTAVSASVLGHKYLRSLCSRGKLPFCRLATKLCGFHPLSDVTSGPGLCLPPVKISAKFWAPPVKIGVRFFTSVRDRKRKEKDRLEGIDSAHTPAHTLPSEWESGSESLWYRHLRPCHYNCQQGGRRATTALNTCAEHVESRFRPRPLLQGYF